MFNYTDHLGNIRVSYGKDPATNVLKILEENHYYPFGLKHTNYNSDKLTYVKEEEVFKLKPINTISPTYKYKYNGKELQEELGLNMYDYGARNYDPALCRWMNIDPLAFNSVSFSPFHYAGNNPTVFIDPDGEDWFFYKKEGAKEADYHWHEGESVDLTFNVYNKDGEVIETFNKTMTDGLKAVVIFNGSRNEKLAKDKTIDGEGAVNAEVILYAPDGTKHTLTGFTMTSDAEKFTPIDEGEYTGTRREDSGSGKLPKYYQMFENGKDNIRTMDGVENNNVPEQKRKNGDGYKTEIFIHRTNNSGTAGGKVSVGCLLMTPGSMQIFHTKMKELPVGKQFKIILNRTK